MKTQETDIEIEIVRSLISTFPDLVPYFEEWVERQGYDKGLFPPYTVLERFADATTNAIAIKNEELAQKYLDFVESFLITANDETRRFFDVAYCENLMWYLKDPELKRWGYSIFPIHIQTLYTELWGVP